MVVTNQTEEPKFKQPQVAVITLLDNPVQNLATHCAVINWHSQERSYHPRAMLTMNSLRPYSRTTVSVCILTRYPGDSYSH